MMQEPQYYVRLASAFVRGKPSDVPEVSDAELVEFRRKVSFKLPRPITPSSRRVAPGLGMPQGLEPT